METHAVILEAPKQISVKPVGLSAPGACDAVVDVRWSGISSGTERLLWSGRMPWFPGLGYPLVPGYEAVGEVAEAGEQTDLTVGDRVFVPGSTAFQGARGLFGANAARLVVPAERVVPVPTAIGADAVCLALAATAQHALSPTVADGPVLVVGHGVLGRLLARLLVARGDGPVTVWEVDAGRRQAPPGYKVLPPPMEGDKPETAYSVIYDASGAASLLDTLIAHLIPRGEIVLAGFYAEPVSFSFPPAFMREARIRVAAEWSREDMTAVLADIAAGRLSLSGLISHYASAADAPDAYAEAFQKMECLKMVLDWRGDA